MLNRNGTEVVGEEEKTARIPRSTRCLELLMLGIPEDKHMIVKIRCAITNRSLDRCKELNVQPFVAGSLN